MLRKLILTTAAAALAAMPIVAQATPAPARTVSPVAGEEELGGALLPVLAAILFAGLLVLVIDGADEPTSP
jgi:hypothetical protein